MRLLYLVSFTYEMIVLTVTRLIYYLYAALSFISNLTQPMSKTGENTFSASEFSGRKVDYSNLK